MNVSDPSVVSPVLAIPGALPSLGDTFGSLLIATFISLVLYGIGMHQTFRYFQEYRKDRRILQMFVGLLIVADTFHTLICCHVCYYYLVVDYFNPLDLQKGIWSIRCLVPAVTSIITIAQAYYIRRVVLLGSKYRYFAIFAIVFVLCAVGFGAVSSVKGYTAATFDDFAKFAWLTSAAYASALACDAVTTTSLIVFLARNKTGFSHTDSMINTIILYTINTGLVTTALNALCVSFALAEKQNLIYVALGFPLCKSYVNSMLAILNSRKGLANAHADAFTVPTIDLLKPIGQSTTSTHGEHMFFSGAIRVNAERSDTLVLRPDDRTSREEDSAGLDVYQLQNMKA